MALILFLAMPSSAGATHDTVNAGRLKELTEQSSALQKAIEAKKREAKEKEELAARQAAAKKQHEQAANRLAGDIKVTEGKINATEGKIDDTGRSIEQQMQSISAKESELITKRQEVNESAAELFIAQNSSSSLMSVVASDSIGSALNEVAALSSLSDKLIEDVTELDRQRTELLAIKARLDEEKQNLEGQKLQLAAYEKALGIQKEQKIYLAEEAKKAQVRFTNEASEALKVTEELRKQFAAIVRERQAIFRSTDKCPLGSYVTAGGGTGQFTWPTGGTITTCHGGAIWYADRHTGIDIGNAAGTSLLAAADGVVTKKELMTNPAGSWNYANQYGYGHWIEIQHSNGYSTRYAHLMDFAVEVGQNVKRGQVVGYMGGGKYMKGAGWSTGPHLHFEVRADGNAFDPFVVLP